MVYSFKLDNMAFVKFPSSDLSRPIDPFHVYVNEVELEDKKITRSDVQLPKD